MPKEPAPAAPPIGRAGRAVDPTRARPLLPAAAVATEVSTPWAIAALIAANLVPLVGVLALDWSVYELMVLYWFENGIIGFFGIFKILLSSGPVLFRLFTAAFFSFHYGAFWSVHGFFVAMLFGGSAWAGEGLDLPFGFFFGGFGIANEALRGALALSALGLFVSHAVSFLGNVVGLREDLGRPPQELMAQPYARVFVLHVTIIGGAALMLGLGAPVLGLALFVLLKTGVDLAAHLKSHRPRPAA